MSDAGYTLTETLAALVVIGLGAGGLSLGLQVIGAQQLGVSKGVAQVQTVAAAQRAIERIVQERAVDPQTLTGSADHFDVACDGAVMCQVRLLRRPNGAVMQVAIGDNPVREIRLSHAAAARFTYAATSGTFAQWPSPGDRQALRAIAVRSSDDSAEPPIVLASVWREQPAVCAFDSIAQACR